MVSILLFEDLLIVPLLALVAFMAPAQVAGDGGSRLLSVAIAACFCSTPCSGCWPRRGRAR